MSRSRRTSKEIRRSNIPRRPVFSGRQLISGRGRQVTPRPLFRSSIGRPRVVLPLSPRLNAPFSRVPGRFVSGRPAQPVRPSRRPRVGRVYQFAAEVKPHFLASSSPCDRRRKTRAMMFVNGVAGRSWGSGGGPKPPSKRALDSQVSCKR